MSKSAGTVRNNVFLENTSGWLDPMMRSSDGGALSIYDHSSPNIEGNILVANRAISENDAGGIFVALWALIGDAAETYDLTNIGTLFAFMLVSIGVLVLRYKEPDRPRPFKVPFPWVVCLLSAAGCVYIMLGLPRTAWERFAAWLVIGLLLYFSYGFKHSRLRKAA